MNACHQVKVGTTTTTYAYYDNGNRKKLTYPNGVTTDYTYYVNAKSEYLIVKPVKSTGVVWENVPDEHSNFDEPMDVE